MKTQKEAAVPESAIDTSAIPHHNPKPNKTIVHTTVIDAPVDHVWKSLIDIDNWTWNKWTRLIVSEPPKKGTKGTLRACPEGNDQDWKEYPFEFAEVDADTHTLAWKGEVPCLFYGYHSMSLEKIDGTRTKLVHREDFGGLLPMIRLGLPYQKLDRNYLLMNEALKAHVERNEAVAEWSIDAPL